MLRLIREMTSDGHTVVMCTHHLVEAEGLADHVVVLDGGTDLVSGAPSDLVRHYWPDDAVEISVTDGVALDVISVVDGVLDVQPTSKGVRVVLRDHSVTPDVVAALVAAGGRVERVLPHEPTLEELYFAVRRSRRDLSESAPPEGVMA